jgi:pimeloyl-ACP methyl ester carboxylesterase
MAHCVLIHGAWQDGWCWEGVIQRLTGAGHSAEAPTLPGHSPSDERSNITFQVHVDFLVDTLSRQRFPVILVGHSSAGLLLQAAAPQTASKIKRLVFHNAVVVGASQRQFDVVLPEEEVWMTAAVNATLDRTIPVEESFLGTLLAPDDTPSFRQALLPQLVPHHWRFLIQLSIPTCSM